MKIRQFEMLAVILGVSISVSAMATPLTFSPFVTSSDLSTSLGNNATIGFAYAGNKFVGSVYYGANNNQLYQTNLSGGGVTTFGAPIPGASGEIYVSSSLGLGGFASRNVFAGSQVAGTVYQFSNDGISNPGSVFVTGLAGAVRGIAFDPYGLYGNDMIVTTNTGNIYRVNSAGVASLLASVGEDTEGLSFAPSAFGTVAAGTLVVASEGSGNLRAISPTGNATIIANVPTAEMVSFVPLNLGISGSSLEGFYAASYPNDVVKASASDFAPYIGDIVVTGEGSWNVTDVAWNGSSYVDSVLGQMPSQPEDGIFVTADILNPGCSANGTCAGSVPEPASLGLMGIGLAGLGYARKNRKKA